jgi:hypothetical protein
MGLRGSCEQKAASQCKGTSASFGSYVLRSGSRFSQASSDASLPIGACPIHSLSLPDAEIQVRRPSLPLGRTGHTQFARLSELKSSSPDSSPFCSNPAHGQNHRSNRGRDSAVGGPGATGRRHEHHSKRASPGRGRRTRPSDLSRSWEDATRIDRCDLITPLQVAQV